MSWIIDNQIGKLSCGPIKTEVDLGQPAKGAYSVTYAGKPVPIDHVLGIEAGYKSDIDASDAYIRGTDLVARYGDTPGDIQPELYWRAINAPNAAGIELILSAQTNLLESRPATNVNSDLNEANLFRFESDSFLPISGQLRPTDDHSIFIARFPDQPFSYIEMLHPSDFDGCEIGVGTEGATISYTVMTESLEKGVIRRVRIRGLFVAADGDEKIAKQLFDDFVQAAPPLTV